MNIFSHCIVNRMDGIRGLEYMANADMGLALVNIQTIGQFIHPANKVHVANMGTIWGREDPVGPRVGPMNLAIWVVLWRAVFAADAVCVEMIIMEI